MERLGALLPFVVVAAGLAACGEPQLSDATVLETWNGLLAESRTCEKLVALSDVRIMDRRVEGPTTTVLLNVHGSWAGQQVGYAGIPLMDEVYKGPCAGFRTGAGAQTIQRRMVFRKYESGWKFEGLDDGTTLRTSPNGPLNGERLELTPDQAREALALRVEPAGSVDAVDAPKPLPGGRWSVRGNVTDANACPYPGNTCNRYTGAVIGVVSRGDDAWKLDQLHYLGIDKYERHLGFQ